MAIFVRTLSIGMGVLGIAASTGCMGGGERYRNAVDPCSMERYSTHARASTMSMFGAQVGNGHILDQTIWTYHFELDSDKLNAGGLDKLDQLLRRRPQPDTQIFLATAAEVPYAADAPNQMADKQRDLDTKRIAAIKRYLTARTASRPMNFDVYVHDPAPVGVYGFQALGAWEALNGGKTTVQTVAADKGTGGQGGQGQGQGNGSGSGNNGNMVPR